MDYIDFKHVYNRLSKANERLTAAKMLLIDKKLGVAVLGTWRTADGWTHWAPLPTFDKA